MKEKESPVWHPYTRYGSTVPIHVVKAKDEFLYTADGRKIIDVISSWWTNIHGHSNKELAKTAEKQIRTLDHVIFAGFTHDPALELAKELSELVPGKPEKIFFSDNGSTAVEVAIKMAMQYHYNRGEKQRQKIVVLKGSYHGDTFGAMSVSERSAFTAPFKEQLFDVIQIDLPGNLSDQEIEKNLSDPTIAAFIYEPLVLGTAGMVMYEPEDLDRLVRLFQDRGVLCIADEVMTGFGRTGKMFASDHLKSSPDLVCLSKGITGGVLPLGVTTVSTKVYEAFRNSDPSFTFYHGHSYTGNPVSCAIAVKSLEILKKKKTIDRISGIESMHGEFAEKVKRQHSEVIKEVRQRGTILAIELRTDNGGYFFKGRDAIYDHFLSQDILIRPLGNVIYLMPPYCISRSSLKKVYAAISGYLRSLVKT